MVCSVLFCCVFVLFSVLFVVVLLCLRCMLRVCWFVWVHLFGVLSLLLMSFVVVVWFVFCVWLFV